MENLLKEYPKLRTLFRLTCFTQELFNMPMWGNYADYHSGFCLEYDLTDLDISTDFFKLLLPVAYEEERIDMTVIFQRLFLSENVPSQHYDDALLHFINVVKHKSWSYEQEWRYVTVDKNNPDSKGMLVEMPINPTAVYLGINSTEKDVNKL